MAVTIWLLPDGNHPDDDQRLRPRCDRVGQRGVGRLVGEILHENFKEGERVLDNRKRRKSLELILDLEPSERQHVPIKNLKKN